MSTGGSVGNASLLSKYAQLWIPFPRFIQNVGTDFQSYGSGNPENQEIVSGVKQVGFESDTNDEYATIIDILSELSHFDMSKGLIGQLVYAAHTGTSTAGNHPTYSINLKGLLESEAVTDVFSSPDVSVTYTCPAVASRVKNSPMLGLGAAGLFAADSWLMLGVKCVGIGDVGGADRLSFLGVKLFGTLQMMNPNGVRQTS